MSQTEKKRKGKLRSRKLYLEKEQKIMMGHPYGSIFLLAFFLEITSVQRRGKWETRDKAKNRFKKNHIAFSSYQRAGTRSGIAYKYHQGQEWPKARVHCFPFQPRCCPHHPRSLLTISTNSQRLNFLVYLQLHWTAVLAPAMWSKFYLQEQSTERAWWPEVSDWWVLHLSMTARRLAWKQITGWEGNAQNLKMAASVFIVINLSLTTFSPLLWLQIFR